MLPLYTYGNSEKVNTMPIGSVLVMSTARAQGKKTTKGDREHSSKTEVLYGAELPVRTQIQHLKSVALL